MVGTFVGIRQTNTRYLIKLTVIMFCAWLENIKTFHISLLKITLQAIVLIEWPSRGFKYTIICKVMYFTTEIISLHFYSYQLSIFNTEVYDKMSLRINDC